MFDPASLNPQQRLAVETTDGPVLILAGAGTGKTRVITCRIARLIQKRVSPSNILGVTFTNKAAREMQERVAGMIGTPARTRRAPGQEAPERPTLCTFHSLCVRILRQHIDKLGYKRNFVIYDESEQLGVIRKLMSHLSISQDKASPEEILAALGKIRAGGPRGIRFSDESSAALAEHFRAKYESALRACNAVDFDDLILLTLRLFREHPDALEACRARYRYVMVDEYQDTNAAQFELIHALTKEHRNCCVVGDDDQSIYGWRGAEIANLLDLEKHYPEVKIIKLEQNYRSTSVILEAANALIRNNPRRRGKSLWSAKGRGALIGLQCFENEEEEARVIVETIENARHLRRVPWGHQAILFRTNIQSRPLETALRKAGVRYHLIGGQSFFDRREVRDFTAYLKVLLNPHDDISLLRIANVPARGLSDVTMERLLAASQERQASVFTTMRHTDVLGTLPARAGEAVRTFSQMIESRRQQLESTVDLKLGPWSQEWLKTMGYLDELRRAEKDPETSENRVRHLQDLAATLDVAGDPADPALKRLEAFLEDITLDREREEDKEAGDAVTLITIHSCKGLEFPHVYVAGLEEGLLPHTRSKEEGTTDEERRLFYVAITRAMESLMLSHCATRKKYGQASPCHPSSFLREVPTELTEDLEARGKAPVRTSEGKARFDALRAAIG